MERRLLNPAIFLSAALVILSLKDVGAVSGRCPSHVRDSCPRDALHCARDSDCGGSLTCCETQCGQACVEPVFTGCENVARESRRARMLGAEGSGVREPSCDAAGQFAPVQCEGSAGGPCWCVDREGAELPGTRVASRELANCTAPSSCAAHTCRMLCQHGFELSADGCPLCRCRDPCEQVRCPGALTCQLERVPCVEEPCPPVPTCKKGRSLENICPVSEPLLIADTHRPFLCGTDPGKPNCPPLYQCLVEKGNDYGVCCPASLKLEKAGSCPADERRPHCGVPCAHDLECPSVQKCCPSDVCGAHCAMPQNVTICLQQKMLAELLVVSELEGRGYVPQCGAGGGFEPRQCSRNGLVCWCVHPDDGTKLRGSMGPAANVSCDLDKIIKINRVESGRSLSGEPCDRQLCAMVCEYGYRATDDGCPTCECADPCEGYACPRGEMCARVRDSACSGPLCSSYPMCRPKVTYMNPCQHDTPYVNDTTGEIVDCQLAGGATGESGCPDTHICTALPKTDQTVCCPAHDYDLVKSGMCPLETNGLCDFNDTMLTCRADAECEGHRKCCHAGDCGMICMEPLTSELQEDEFDRIPTMCEYLRDFDDKMEGTHDGMMLALPRPRCHDNGSFTETQCHGGYCWCVDSFGTEIPRTRGKDVPLEHCLRIREEVECLELTCRLGCDYGFVMDAETRCPACMCRSPCSEVSCEPGHECQMVDVACDGDYCPAVPACLPRKVGQCPYLVPSLAGSCEFECHSDVNCNGTRRCCPNGCGTQCVEPVLKTTCQHQQAIALHAASEAGIPARRVWVPACDARGAFERVQCLAAVARCWCVDAEGRELPGTSLMGGQLPQCPEPAAICPALKCESECEHGRALDATGCPTCACRDPCRHVACTAENEVCTLVKVECVSEPCPPVAMCLPAPGAACPGGALPLPAPGSARPLQCGPAAAACPSSHKCQLSPLAGTESTAVCCPKPRSVCFEPKDKGACINSSAGVPNVTRWYFNPEKNRCEKFTYGGCSGTHNNFQTEQICNSVCPVLSQCERLREKNQKAAVRYRKQTFMPSCDSETGKWMNVQCMTHIGVCWCVNARGEPLKGSLVRDSKPDCNFRQARRWSAEPRNQADEVLEELIKQMTAYTYIDSRYDEDDNFEDFQKTTDEGDLLAAGSDEPLLIDLKPLTISIKSSHEEKIREKLSHKAKPRNRCFGIQQRLKEMNSSYVATCDTGGMFTPTQCDEAGENSRCWCVDQAGNQLPGTTTFAPGNGTCVPTPIESIDVKLGFFGEYSYGVAEFMKNQMLAELKRLGATLKDDRVEVLNDTQSTFIHFTVIGNNKIDVAYHLEELVKEEKIELNMNTEEPTIQMVADITRSRFHHNIGNNALGVNIEEKTIALQHREIVSESTVSLVTPYHTAIIVLAAASAFIISVMSVLIMLYRKKASRLGETDVQKVPGLSERFLAYNTPIYVLSSTEKADLAEAMRINESLSHEKL